MTRDQLLTLLKQAQRQLERSQTLESELLAVRIRAALKATDRPSAPAAWLVRTPGAGNTLGVQYVTFQKPTEDEGAVALYPSIQEE